MSREAWALVAVVCALVAGGGGYLAGHSGGADVQRARATGEQLGQARGAADRRGYKAAFSQARKAGFREGYRTAYRKASRGAGK